MTNQLNKTAVIIGGGPAGCQCALWLKMLGSDPLILEKSNQLGGLQNESPYKNNWVVGLLNTTGRELAHHIDHHIKSLDIPIIFNAKIKAITAESSYFMVQVSDQLIKTNYLVIAAGVKQYRQSSSSNQFDYDALNRQLSRKEWEAVLPEALVPYKKELLGDDGFILTDNFCCTPIKNIYAIGEGANRMPPCVVTSMADGVVAAKAIHYLCAE
ncbi:MAG: FAD-dependent pyridine nucleotide-disulfide oxidoreductase [uncultured bacterium]|nr:MAG: FAD-dependent pyridine nucleotide-disulfide oxidoreductase [uncultured bacterium]